MDVAHAAELAFAQFGGGASGSTAMLTQVAFFAAIFAIFYFLLIRPQQQQKRETERMRASLKKGDRVVTTGGLHGTVLTVNDQTVVLRVSDQVKLEFDRSAVGRVMDASADRKDA
jgi:preprotein translocase subunit YajC